MMSEDLSLFFNTAEHAVLASWQIKQIAVIRNRPYAETLGIASSDCVIIAPEADFAGIAKGQAVTIESVNYTVSAIEPNGTGLVAIQLRKA